MNESDIEHSLQKETLENENNLNLEDYKDIYENQKFQTKLNFFENSADSTIRKKSEKKIMENINVISSRKPIIISNNKIDKLNNVYDKYKKKIDDKDKYKDKDNVSDSFNDKYIDIDDKINLKEEIDSNYEVSRNNDNIKDYINESINSNLNNKQELLLFDNDNNNSHISSLLGKKNNIKYILQ
jgi:hypothetical protein